MRTHGWMGEVNCLTFENRCVLCGEVMSIRAVQNHYERYVKEGGVHGTWEHETDPTGAQDEG